MVRTGAKALATSALLASVEVHAFIAKAPISPFQKAGPRASARSSTAMSAMTSRRGVAATLGRCHAARRRHAARHRHAARRDTSTRRGSACLYLGSASASCADDGPCGSGGGAKHDLKLALHAAPSGCGARYKLQVTRHKL